MVDSKTERVWTRLPFTVLAVLLVVCAGLQVRSAKAQDAPDQEQGPPPLPPPGDPEAGFVEPPPRDKKPSRRKRSNQKPRRKRSDTKTSPRQERGGSERDTEGQESGGHREKGSFSGRSTYPDSGKRGGQQTQVLGRGVLRIEGGPADFTLRDSGMLGEGRGLRIGRADHGDNADPYAGLGLGASFGVMENLELGILQLPIIFANGSGDADFGNIELHGRVGIIKSGPVEFGAQLVVQLPSNRAFGVGFGLPLRILATDALIIDFGVETEVVTFISQGDGTSTTSTTTTIVNLDVPVAINYYVTPAGFLGVRSGLFALDFDEVYVPLGVQGGYGFLDGMVELMGWFQWAAIPLGEYRYGPDDVFDAGSFEFGIGANVFLGFPRGG